MFTTHSKLERQVDCQPDPDDKKADGGDRQCLIDAHNPSSSRQPEFFSAQDDLSLGKKIIGELKGIDRAQILFLQELDLLVPMIVESFTPEDGR